jgi:thiamine biosynthesis lipoprotein
MGLVSGLVRPVGLAALGGSAAGGSMLGSAVGEDMDSSTPGTALGRRFAVHGAVFHGAAFVGPLLGGLLYAHRSMGPVLLALACCLGLAALATALLLPGGATTRRREPPREAPGPGHGLAPARRGPALLAAIAGRSLGIGLCTAFYPIVLAEVLGRHGLVVAATYAVPGLATFLGLLLSWRLGRGRPSAGRILLGMLISAGGLFALGECRQLWQFLAAGVVMGGGAALSIPASMAMASTLATRQGAVFGAANLASGLGFLAGPLLGGGAVQHLHAPAAGLRLAALLGALACVPLAGLALRERLGWGAGPRAAVSAVLVALLLGAGLLALPLGEDQNQEDDHLYRFTDIAMGTVVHLTIEAQGRESASLAAERALAAMRDLQRDYDHRNPRGSIGRINRAAGRFWVRITPGAFGLLERALRLSAASEGVFDPSIGALTTSPFYFAVDESIAREKSGLVDYHRVLLDREGGRARLEREGMALDLGGIAKGAIVDAAVAVLREQGVASGIVEAGGDFRCFGQREWNVGIRHPRSGGVFRTLSIREKSVCGSGDYQQFVGRERADGSMERHHIIDPRTMGSAHESIGVSVVADTAEEADALATTLFIMGPSRGGDFLKRYSPSSACVWFLPDQSVAYTDNFPR